MRHINELLTTVLEQLIEDHEPMQYTLAFSEREHKQSEFRELIQSLIKEVNNHD